MDWPYYTFKDGELLDESGDVCFGTKFKSAEEAEQYLIDNDIRGTIK